MDGLDCSSWNISFLLGDFKDLETRNEFSRDEFSRFVKTKIAVENASMQLFGQWLSVSRMTLNPILSSENVICNASYYAF